MSSSASVTRRVFLRQAALLAAAGYLLPSAVARAATDPQSLAEQALATLRAGNLRFQQGRLQHPHETLQRRHEIVRRQAPLATVLACSDSRESPELIFDQGLGDLFVVRTAGHVLDDAVVGTLEYAVQELQVPLLVVMGHQSCGAVAATLQSVESTRLAAGQMETLVDAIRPAVLLGQGAGEARFTSIVQANVRLTMERLANSRLLLEAVAQQRLRIVGAYYELESGIVQFLA
ncbi:carbonic anhydrase [Hymenobacter sp. NST-14]|uniref:carbonic anhydrase n=1 Tax=Hymenobacter piscis TaxID=2839984 RepID=UPI001C022CE9|nr:carbonic anhydrase [Hymenobacter piscis]MBT9395020.1 carbonic anhydrase [Hymenobacter piscis]